MFVKEFGIIPEIYVDSGSLVSTPFDMLLNQTHESMRGDNVHGSCGVGFGETIERALVYDSLFMVDIAYYLDNDMDGLPNVLLESMALEIPTISTDVTGIPELIQDGENGIIVPQKDALALAEAIITIQENPDFAERIRKNGRKRVLQEFDAHQNVRKLAEIFEQ